VRPICISREDFAIYKHLIKSFLLLALGIFATPASAQFTDFPIGISGVPHAKLKGPVHSVLTIQQRGEYVFSTVVEIYDPTGRLTETLSSNANIEIHSGTLVRLGGKSVFLYDSQGRRTKEMKFTPEGRYSSYELCSYDSRNRLIETRYYDTADKETGKTTYTYYPDRREVLVTWNFHYEGRIPPPMKNLLTYNEKDQWTKRQEFDRNGRPADAITFDYDVNGNLIRETHNGFSHRYTYEFDNQGNWIEQRNIYNQPGEPEDREWMRKYRVITYYNDGNAKPPKQ
jgi:YD repeat-containing protein